MNITLRQWYAGQALSVVAQCVTTDEEIKVLVQDAFRVADAMMAYEETDDMSESLNES
jgi:hypothetical protein